MEYRVGIGYDVHRLEKGIPFRLGGVDIPHTHGAAGHSDADVLVHALCDALLGAAALGDIGQHFPDTDEAYRDINSLQLLKKTVELLDQKGYAIGNIDSTICLQSPKISPHIADMRTRLAQILRIPQDRVSVKATTEEKMGISGSGEGVSAYAVAMIGSKKKAR